MRRDGNPLNRINSAFMLRTILFWSSLVSVAFAILLPPLSHAKEKKQLPAVRWTSGAPGCRFERRDDGKYLWTMTSSDLTVTLLVDSQELAQSRHRFYGLFGAFLSVTYTGKDKFEFPAGSSLEFVRHHEFREPYEDPKQLSLRLQNDVDTKIFDTERQIKKNPKLADEKTARLREYQKQSAEFIEFLSTKTLDPDTVMLTPGNPEAHGWVLFATSNKWIGPWKEREDFILYIGMKDKMWQFPFSLPPTGADLILRKPPD
jgi:hypothetical protein